MNGGPVAVVTGASRGLGAGLAARLAARGWRLGLCARHRPADPDPAGRSLCAVVDVTDAGAVDAFAEAVAARMGPVGLWVNNAGRLGPVGPLADTDPGELRDNLLVNVLGTTLGSRAYARHVRARPGGGALVNISSGAATRPYRGWAAYGAAKAAVDQLTAVVAAEGAEHGLRAWAVSPGLVDTDMQAAIRATGPEQFPDVGRFLDAARAGAFNSPGWVADRLLDLVAGGGDGPVVVRLPDQPADDAGGG